MSLAKKTMKIKKGQLASYNLSLLIAKSGHPFTSGEKLVLPAIKEVISTVLIQDPTSVIQTIPLSNDSVARRINEMGSNVENQICDILKTSTFSLQLDETSTFDGNALLMAYVRYINPRTRELSEELLFSQYLETDCKGQSIFNTIKNYFELKSIALKKFFLCNRWRPLYGW